MWTFGLASAENWNVGEYKKSTKSQRFIAEDSGKASDLRVLFQPGRFLVEYFEMGAKEPTKSKEFIVTTDVEYNHQATWNATNAVSGMHIYRIHAGDFIQSRQMLLIK